LSTRLDTGDRDSALVSVDLDDAWAYLRAHGDPHWKEAPSILGLASERLLSLFAELDVRATVFVAGRDALSPTGRAVIQAFQRAGHEISNHSFDHRFDLAHLSVEEIESDLRRSADEIGLVTGVVLRGFRSPSFGVSANLHEVLSGLGYLYDASLLPTFLGPLLRWYHRRSMKGRPSSTRPEIFGSFSDGLLPMEAFEWEHDDFNILEIPVTTLPLIRTPLHMSYLHALRARVVADNYLRFGLALCRLRRYPVSFLIHPPDVVDAEEAPALAYLPGMTVPWKKKVDLVRSALSRVVDGRIVQTHRDYSQGLGETGSVRWTPRSADRQGEH
jgi:hypothetical protein